MRKSLVSMFIIAACVVSVSYCSSDNGGGTVAVTSVSLNKSSTTLCVGGSAEQLFATVLPSNATNKSVTWSSSTVSAAALVTGVKAGSAGSANAASVATVGTDGLVTPVMAGSATITVTTADGNKTATCTVAVSTQCVAVTGVSLNKTTATVSVDGSEQLLATIAPTSATNQNVTWSSSDDSVATVSAAGLVTGVKAGSATITVTTVDQGKHATCAVTVTAAYGIISGKIDNWSNYKINNPTQQNITTGNVRLVIRKDTGTGNIIDQILSDLSPVGVDGSFTVIVNAVPNGTYLKDVSDHSITWPSGLIISPTSGVKLLGATGNYQAVLNVYDDNDNPIEKLVILPKTGTGADMGGLWYGTGALTGNGTGTIDTGGGGGTITIHLNNVTFPAGWSFIVATVSGTKEVTMSLATSGSDVKFVPDSEYTSPW